MPRAPFDVVNEQVVLSSMINCPKCRRRAIGSLHKEDFQGSKHRILFESVCACELNGVKPDKANIAVHCEEEEFGGLDYVDKLLSMGIADGFEKYLERLKRESSRRRAVKLLPEVQECLEDRGRPHVECIDAASTLLKELRNVSARSGIHGTADQWLQEFQARCDGDVPFVPTGFASIDRHLVEGLAPRRITVIAGRPGAGKSTLLVDLVRRQLERRKKPRILVLPLESGRVRFLDMLVSCSTGIESSRIIKTPDKLSLEERERIQKVAKKIAGTDDRLEVMDNPFVDLGGKWTNDSALERLEEILADGGYDILAMDLFQRMLVDWSAQRINGALMRVQSILKRYEVHGILLSQLSRKAEDRSKDRTRRPVLGDLKDAGMYEEVADVIWLMHRERMYTKHLRDDVVEVGMEKQRVGEAGITMMADFEPWVFRLVRDKIGDVEQAASFVP